MGVDRERLKKSDGTSNYSNASALHVYRPISRFFSMILLRLPVTPNQLTVFWGLLMIVSSILFFFNDYVLNIVGGIGWVVAYALDFSDGDIARYKNLKSKRGKYLDLVNHRATYPLMMFAIGFGQWSSGDTTLFGINIDPVAYLITGFLAGLGMIMIMDLGDIYNKSHPEGIIESDKGSAAVEGNRIKNQRMFRFVMNINPLTFTNMMLLIPVFAVLGYLEVFILFYGVFYPLASFGRYIMLGRMVPGVQKD